MTTEAQADTIFAMCAINFSGASFTRLPTSISLICCNVRQTSAAIIRF